MTRCAETAFNATTRAGLRSPDIEVVKKSSLIKSVITVSDLLGCRIVLFLLYPNVSEEYFVSIFRTEVP